jgi:cytochrome b6-f complex iron-sulfur subunit
MDRKDGGSGSTRRLPMLGDAERLVDRRAFIAQSTMIAALAALAGSCSSNPFGVTLDQSVTVSLADYPELADEGGVARLRDVTVPIAVVNLGSGEYAALSLVCPHQGGPVSWNGSEFWCSEHGATFAEDGRWTGGQPTSHLREYNVTFDDVAGTVTVSP